MIEADISSIPRLSSLIAFSALILSSLIAWSLSCLIASITLCSRSSIRYLSEEKLLSIDSEDEAKESSSLSMSEDTDPPTVFTMSVLMFASSLVREGAPIPAMPELTSYV